MMYTKEQAEIRKNDHMLLDKLIILSSILEGGSLQFLSWHKEWGQKLFLNNSTDSVLPKHVIL
jgi:hypothetical protein